MYAFLARHLGLDLRAVRGADGKVDEGQVVVEKESLLRVFTRGRPRPARALRDGAEVELALLGLPMRLATWLRPQKWKRDAAGPVLSLGEKGSFDAAHLLAPCVARRKGTYFLWYSGSAGPVEKRLYRLGLATSADGKAFARSPAKAVFEFGDGRRSVLTPTLLRRPGGAVLREKGRLRMWFVAADLAASEGLHTLHQITSADGVRWSRLSARQLENVYAPTLIKEAGAYRMWYVDLSTEPWAIRHARSPDGRRWRVTKAPALVVDQKWEEGRLFYPTVVRSGGVYLMWYGSYWRTTDKRAAKGRKTAIGFAVSTDGLTWHKSPHSPVFTPEPTREWESNYTTSQSVLALGDGSWRMWYAARRNPPFHNKYFAIGTARWAGPAPTDPRPGSPP